MAVRFSLLVVILAIASGGCATATEERLTRLESTVESLRTQEIRLAIIEDTLNSLIAAPGNAPGNASGNAPGHVSGETYPGARELAYPAGAPASSAAKTAPARDGRASPPASAASVRAASVQAVPGGTSPAGSASRAQPQAGRDYQKALSTLESGNPAAAASMFRDFLHAYPGHDLAPNAGYWLGECSYSQKQYDTAIIAFKDVVALYPAHAKAAAAMLKAGYSYSLLGDTANARFYLEALLKDYPDSAPAALARARLASL